jgi:hypothetical protein
MDTATAETTAGSQPASGAPGDSPTPQTVVADSSPPGGSTEPKTIAEALERVEADLEQPPEEAGGGQSTEVKKSAESPTTEAGSEQTPAGEAGKKDGKPAEPVKVEDPDVPFHTRKEWQDAIAIAGDKIKPVLREILKSETRAREQMTQLKPLADVASELRQIAGGDKEFDTMRQVVRAYATGDPAVLPILRQMVQTIEKSSGEVISSPDLLTRAEAIQKQFDNGVIDQAEYQTQTGLLKEIERNRAGKRTAETTVKVQQQTQAEQQARQALEREASSINSWETNIRSRDPDFGNVTDVNDPKHGESVADQVFDAMCLKRAHQPNSTTDDLLAVAQRAYSLAKGRVSGPAPRQNRVITSQTSSITGRQRPKTMREAMDAVKLD